MVRLSRGTKDTILRAIHNFIREVHINLWGTKDTILRAIHNYLTTLPRQLKVLKIQF